MMAVAAGLAIHAMFVIVNRYCDCRRNLKIHAQQSQRQVGQHENQKYGVCVAGDRWDEERQPADDQSRADA